MDKLSIISGALFFAADIFAVISLAMPQWIVSDIGGKIINCLIHSLTEAIKNHYVSFLIKSFKL